MNKLLLILLLLCSVQVLHGQRLTTQSSDRHHERLLREGKVGRLMLNFGRVVGNDQMTIQVVFLGPYMGNLTVGVRGGIPGYILQWRNNNANADKILFLFQRTQPGEYTFRDFAVTQRIQNTQLHEIVLEYIRDQILRPIESTNVEEIVFRGLNAIKNAYDRSFQQAMVNNARTLLTQRRFYRGFAYAAFDWFNFIAVENQNRMPYDLEVLYRRENSGYTPLPPFSVRRLLDNQNTTYVLRNGQRIRVGDTEVSSRGYSFYFEGANVANLDRNRVYQRVKTEILDNIYTFSFLEYTGRSPNRVLHVRYDENQMALSQQHRVQVVRGRVLAGEEINKFNGMSFYGHLNYSQPTWCNTFARHLTRNTYLRNEFILENVVAERMNARFRENPHKFRDITHLGEDVIWESFINRGYLVLFSTTGHIEVGFPDGVHHLDWRRRHIDDMRYPDAPYLRDRGRTSRLTVGAGVNVGYMSASDWATNSSSGAQAFLYLYYLGREH